MKEIWEQDAQTPDAFHSVACTRGREFILRLTTGADAFKAIQNFAKVNKIRYAKIHTSFMGGFAPARFLIWSPDTANPDNWHCETVMEIQNLSMLLSCSGIIHPRPAADGGEEPFPAIHFVIGGAWNVPTIGGHLYEGSIVKGAFEVFITEIEGIEVLYPQGKIPNVHAQEFPENWYKEVK
jgi:predicted DNA-binding protein with PD1-like motif